MQAAATNQFSDYDPFKKCPKPPVKDRKCVSRSSNLSSTPSPLCFNKTVTLSPMYNPKKKIPYFEQIFDKLGSLGEGSFGKVYRVHNKEDNKVYAIKKLKNRIARKDRCAEVINNEMIGYHPNIVQYFMAWQENFDTYIMLEFCDMSLADYVKCTNYFPEELSWTILYDICQALQCLHEKQFIHLDVKPGNIMMKKGVYKLGDFGLLVVLNKNKAQITTLSDGDSKYLAMEVLNKIYTPFCDIFSLGITIIELAANFKLPEDGKLWHKLRLEPLPHEIYSKMSFELNELVQQMIAKTYLERPSAVEILLSPPLRNVVKRDTLQPRKDYAEPYINDFRRQVLLSGSPVPLKYRFFDKENFGTHGSEWRRSLFSANLDKSASSSKDCCILKPDCELSDSCSMYDSEEPGKDIAANEVEDIVSLGEFSGNSISPVSTSRKLKKVKLLFD